MINRRVIAVLIVSIASGLPLLLSGQTLQAWYTQAGVSLVGVGSLSLVGLPYLLKFMWAPLIDRFSIRGGASHQGWMLVTQACIIISVVVMAYLTPSSSSMLMAVVALVLAFVSASQDIVINSYSVEILSDSERGIGASMLFLGYRLGMMLSGALALVVADMYGFSLTYILMAILMLVVSLYTFCLPKVSIQFNKPQTLGQAIILPIKQFFSRDRVVSLLALIVLYKLSDSMAFNMNIPFLLRHIGFSIRQVGEINKTVSLFGMLSGSVIAGAWITRVGLYRALWVFGVMQVVSNVGYMWMALVGKNVALMALTFFIEYFCSGMATVALVALMMTLCDKRYSATQYALYTALMGLPRVLLGPVCAELVKHFGWFDFYFFTTLAGLPGLYVLYNLGGYKLFTSAGSTA